MAQNEDGKPDQGRDLEREMAHIKLHIRAYRQASGMSVGELKEKMGGNQKFTSRLEHPTKNWKMHHYYRIIHELGVDTDYIFHGKTDRLSKLIGDRVEAILATGRRLEDSEVVDVLTAAGVDTTGIRL